MAPINDGKTHHPNEVDYIVKINKPLEPDKEVNAMMKICETRWICMNCGKRAKHRLDIKEHVKRDTM